MRSKLFVFLVAAGLLLVLAACQPAAGAGATQNFTVIMGEGEVIAASLSCLMAKYNANPAAT